jgi:hypothetical protein
VITGARETRSELLSDAFCGRPPQTLDSVPA